MRLKWYMIAIIIWKASYILDDGVMELNCTEIIITLWFQWASHQIRKIACCAHAGNVGNVFPATGVGDPD